MPLSVEEIDLVDQHKSALNRTDKKNRDLLGRYEGRSSADHIGMALPPIVLQRFKVRSNWHRPHVDAKADRCQLRSIYLDGDESMNDKMKLIFDASRLPLQAALAVKDAYIFGICHFAIGKESDDTPTVIRAVSPMHLSSFVDPSTGEVTSAARFYRDADNNEFGVLFLPDCTVHIKEGDSGWEEDSDRGRDSHNLGIVPVVTYFNRRITGRWEGESEMTDLIPIVDAVERALTNMQFAQEAAGVPPKFITGISDEESRDAQGRIRSKMESYFNAIQFIKDKDARPHQLAAAGLDNFKDAILACAQQASTLTGLPLSTWGVSTANPQTEGAIVADENRLVRDVESDNALMGEALGRAAQIAWLNEEGQMLELAPIVEWFDASTPTVAQREDALAKRRAMGALSLRGYWKELGWSETEINREIEWLKLEQEEFGADPTIAKIASGGLLSNDGVGFGAARGDGAPRGVSVGGLELTA